MHFNLPNNRGFTLIELLVTIALVAILGALAAPSLQQLLASNRIQSATSDIHAALGIARAEAIKRGGDARVTIVANTLTGTTPNWSSGLTVFFDTTSNANGNAPSSDGSKLIMKTAEIPAGVTINVNFNHIIFNGFGRSINSTGASTGGVIAIGAENADWRCTIIGLTGRVRTEKISSAAYNAVGCPTN